MAAPPGTHPRGLEPSVLPGAPSSAGCSRQPPCRVSGADLPGAAPQSAERSRGMVGPAQPPAPTAQPGHPSTGAGRGPSWPARVDPRQAGGAWAGMARCVHLQCWRHVSAHLLCTRDARPCDRAPAGCACAMPAGPAALSSRWGRSTSGGAARAPPPVRQVGGGRGEGRLSGRAGWPASSGCPQAEYRWPRSPAGARLAQGYGTQPSQPVTTVTRPIPRTYNPPVLHGIILPIPDAGAVAG
jgi:hypothetical protein